MQDLLNPEPYSLATSEPYVPWSPFPDWMGGPAQMVMNLAAQAGGGGYGMANYGFMHQGNLYNNMQQQAWLTRHNLAVMTAARGDTDSIVSSMRGIAALNNVTWNKEQEMAARNWASWASGVGAPVMLQSEVGTTWYDAFQGGRSQAVMTKYAMLSGRFMDDPLGSGSARYSARAGELTGGMLYDRLFGGPPEAQQGMERWRRTAGLTSMEVGNLMQEMTMRGQIAPLSGGTGDEMAMATSNVDNIKRALESRMKTVEALKEIFGSVGQPNAPMAKLLNALEAFTGGSQQISTADNPQRLEMIVRNLHNAANQAGVPMQIVSALMQGTSQNLAAAGLNQAFTPQIVQEQLIQRAALQRTGVMATPAWGLLNVDQLSQLHNTQMQGATGSDFGNFLGAAARLRARGLLDSSTAEGKLMETVLRQAESGTLGAEGLDLATADSTRFGELLQKGFGISASGVTAELTSRHANSEFIYKAGLNRAITNYGQPAELGKRLGFTGSGMAFATANAELTEFAARRGLKMDSAAALSEAMAANAWSVLSSLDNATLQDTDKRNAAIAGAMRAALPTDGSNPLAAALLADPNSDKLLATLGERMFNQADLVARGQDGRGPGLLNLLVGNTPEVRRQRERQQSLSRISSHLQSEMAGIGKDNPMLRMVDTLIGVGYDPAGGDLSKILKETLGFKDADAQARLLKPQIDALVKARSDFQSKLDAVGTGSNGALSEQEKEIARANVDALTGKFNDFQKLLQENPALKAAFDKINNDLAKQSAEAEKAAGAQDSALTFNIDTLTINGTELKDAKGETKGTAKPADGRNKGGV